MAHTELLRRVGNDLHARGFTVLTEQQNSFHIRGSSGAMLGGKPDLVALFEGHGTVYDVKTSQPRTSDQAKVMIYMYTLPHLGRFCGVEFDGRVVYRDHEISIRVSAVDKVFKDWLFAQFVLICSQDRCRKVPSVSEGRFCELTPTDCPERIDGEPADF